MSDEEIELDRAEAKAEKEKIIHKHRKAGAKKAAKTRKANIEAGKKPKARKPKAKATKKAKGSRKTSKYFKDVQSPLGVKMSWIKNDHPKWKQTRIMQQAWKDPEIIKAKKDYDAWKRAKLKRELKL